MKITKNELKRMINESVKRQLSKVNNTNEYKKKKRNISESIDIMSASTEIMSSRNDVKSMFSGMFKNEQINISYDKLNGGLIVSLLDSEINLYVIGNTIIGINDNLKNTTKFSMFWKNYKSIPQLLNGIDNYNPTKNRVISVSKLINNFLKQHKLKYYLSYTDYKNYDGRTVFKIMYRSGISVDGGYIESESNLSQTGKSVVYGNAIVYHDARVYENAQVFGNATICDNAEIYGNAQVYENAEIFGSAKIYGNAKVYGSVEIYWDAEIYDNSIVCGKSEIQGYSEICDTTYVKNSLIKNSIINGASNIQDSKISIAIRIKDCNIINSVLKDDSIKYINLDIVGNIEKNSGEYI